MQITFESKNLESLYLYHWKTYSVYNSPMIAKMMTQSDTMEMW